MTELSTKDLLRLAIPSMLFALLTHAYRSIDQYWVQGLGPEAQGALGASVFTLILFAALFMLLSGGVTPLVSQATGAKDLSGRVRSIGSAIYGVWIITAIIMVAGGFGADFIASILGLKGETALQFTAYIRTISLTVFPLALTPVVDQSFIAMGEAKIPLKLHASSLLLNIILTPLFIYNLDLGIAGAALASNGSRFVTTSIGLVLLARRTGLKLTDVKGGPELLRVVTIGTPVAASIAAYTLVYWGMLATSISQMGPEVIAALGIGFSALEGFTWPCFHGVSLAVSSFVGRYIGAGKAHLARKVVQQTIPLSAFLGLSFGAIFLLFGSPLTALFTNDEAVHQQAILYTQIIGYSQIFVAMEALFEGAMMGAGTTKVMFWLSAPFNFLRVPIAWYLGIHLGYGASGIWWAITATSILKSSLKGLYIWRFPWADSRV